MEKKYQISSNIILRYIILLLDKLNGRIVEDRLSKKMF